MCEEFLDGLAIIIKKRDRLSRIPAANKENAF